MKVLITGAESTKALIIARAIGGQGYRVVTAGATRYAPAYFSKYSRKHYVYGDPKKDTSKFLSHIRSIISEENVDILIPTHSSETPYILYFKNELEKYVRIPFVDYGTFTFVNDKYNVFHLAQELGIRVPQTWRFSNVDELESHLGEITFPAVIKLPNKSGNKGLSYVGSRTELIEKFIKTTSMCAPEERVLPLVQEFIPGDGYGTSVLYSHGSLKAIFTHRRLREFPASGGPSTLRVGIKNGRMEEIAERFMDNLKWHGVAMLEFKLDRRNSEPVLLEVNPRFWGSIYTPIVSGINFPLLLCELASGADINPVSTYETGIKTRFLLLDLLAFPGHFFSATDKLKLVKEYLAPNAYYDVETWSDFRATVYYYLHKLVLQHLS